MVLVIVVVVEVVSVIVEIVVVMVVAIVVSSLADVLSVTLKTVFMVDKGEGSLEKQSLESLSWDVRMNQDRLRSIVPGTDLSEHFSSSIAWLTFRCRRRAVRRSQGRNAQSYQYQDATYQ